MSDFLNEYLSSIKYDLKDILYYRKLLFWISLNYEIFCYMFLCFVSAENVTWLVLFTNWALARNFLAIICSLTCGRCLGQ